jgi:hypothetical protein
VADNLCVTVTAGNTLIVSSDASVCDYILVSATNYQQQQALSENFMQWFTFDTTDALGAFAVGLTLWAAGIKIGAVVRTIFY